MVIIFLGTKIPVCRDHNHRGNILDEAKTNACKEASGQGFLAGKIHHDILRQGKGGPLRDKPYLT